jgi:hypothetical protein
MVWCEYAQIPVIGRMDVEMRVHGAPLAILPAARKLWKNWIRTFLSSSP